MKKNILFTGAAFAVIAMLNCGPKKSGATDMGAAINEAIAVQLTAATALEKAANGKEAAAALNNVRETMEGLEKKFPQIKEFEKNPEFAPLAPKFKEASDKFGNALMAALQKFQSSPEFDDAMKKSMKPADGK